MQKIATFNISSTVTITHNGTSEDYELVAAITKSVIESIKPTTEINEDPDDFGVTSIKIERLTVDITNFETIN